MIKYRKIQITYDCVVTHDSNKEYYLGTRWEDEVEFLNCLAACGWELVTIVDDHQTFIFKGIF